MNLRRLPLLLIAATVLGGSYLRLSHLDRDHFNGDELDHYYAAQSLAAGQGPLLPSGNPYVRGIDITRFVSMTLDVGDSAETAARLPAALFGILNLILIAAIAWMVAGPWPAVWATLLLAIYPEAIVQSRMTRFYTYQLDCGLLALFTGWLALRNAGDLKRPGRADLISSYLWGGATLVLFALGSRVQVTTYPVAVGWSVCVGLAAIADISARGIKQWRSSFPLQATLLLVVASALVLLGFQGIAERNLAISQYVPAWGGTGHPLTYYYRLNELFPVIISLLPVVFLVAVVRKPRLGVYLATWFSVPILIHSLILPWKGERYVLLAIPALFIAAGMAAASGWGALRRWLDRVVAEQPRLPAGVRRWGPSLGVAVVAAFVLVTQHGFNEARRIPPIPKQIDWRMARSVLEEVPHHESLPVGTSIALPALYYWDRADFVVGTDFLEAPRADGSSQKQMLPEGEPDWYGGVPVLVRPSTIRARYDSAGAVIIGIDSDRWRWGNIDDDLRLTLTREAEELCRDRCGDFLLFLWRFDDVQSGS